jgi:hypothetical protein
MMNISLIIYRISGWAINITTLFLAFTAVRSKNLWKEKYVYIGILLCFVAFADLISSITALLLSNNLFIEYFRGPIVFSLKAFYLREQHKNKGIRIIMVWIILILIAFQIYIAFDHEAYREFNANAIGVYSISIFFLLFTIWNLTLLFKGKSVSRKLRNTPDFWFTATMFCFTFLGTIITILADTSYAADSDIVLYILFVFENFLKVILYFGYYKAIKLLK